MKLYSDRRHDVDLWTRRLPADWRINGFWLMQMAPPVRVHRESFMIVPFLLGMTCLVEVSVVGRLMGSDIVCVIGCVYALARPTPGRQLPLIKALIWLTFLWYLGASLTDLIRGTPVEDVMRGQSRIIVLLAAIIFLSNQARRSPDWVVCFWAGLVLSLGVKPFFVEQLGFSEAPWKFGLGLAAIGASVLIIERFPIDTRARRLAATSLIGLMAVISLLTNSRSLFALLVVSTLLIIYWRWIYGAVFKGGTNLGGFLGLMAAGFLVIQGVAAGYGYLADSGALGDDARNKYEAQAKLGLNEIQSGRHETLVSFRAIGDSPIIGHGSWARDPYYALMLVDILKEHGAELPPSADIDDLIPSHSHIFGAWVEHGILSLPFWLCAMWLLLLGVQRALMPDCEHREVTIIVALLAVWDILFSPFGAQERVLLAAACVMAATALRNPLVGPRRRRRSTSGNGLTSRLPAGNKLPLWPDLK